MRKKKSVLAVVALVLVAAVFLGAYLLTRPGMVWGDKVFTVIVVHKDGSERTFTYQTEEACLGPALVKEGLIVMDDKQSGMFSTVDNVTVTWETDKAYWALYVGDDYASLGINETPVYHGSTFKLVYTLG